MYKVTRYVVFNDSEYFGDRIPCIFHGYNEACEYREKVMNRLFETFKGECEDENDETTLKKQLENAILIEEIITKQHGKIA